MKQYVLDSLFFQELDPALRTRYFLFFQKENELRQMLRSGLKKAYYRRFQAVIQPNVSRETFYKKIKI
jgi:hypothetical protein